MPSDAMPSEAPDWSRRADPEELPEWMDAPCTYEEFRACLKDLRTVNRLTLGYRPTLRWLDENFGRPMSSRPLRIVDVGCGGGDLLREIHRWSRRNNIPVTLTGIDLNPHAVRAGNEWTPSAMHIDYICGDAFAYSPQGGMDVVVSSLMTHHLPDVEIARFAAWMDRTARRGWFINDLRRSQRAAKLFGALAAALRWHPFVRHDGPVSFRRAFSEADWERLLEIANVRDATIKRWEPGRLCVSKVKA